MSKYKVGDRVWSCTQNRYMFVSQVENQGCFLADDEKLRVNYWHINNEISEIFDTMITKLGFGDEGFLKNHFHNDCGDIYHLYYGKKDTKYDNYRIFIFNNFYVINRFDYDSSAKIDKPLHKALTQLMREMKADE